MVMDIKKPVVVTALYDIGRDKWEKFTQSYGGYIHWMERTLSLDCDMVIYTESKFYEEIRSYRIKYDPNLNRTNFVIQELENLTAYKLYNQELETLMFSEEFLKKAHFDVPEMNRPLYNVIMFNKVFWLKHTVDNKLFDNDMVIWADAGGLREPVEIYKLTSWPNIDKINEIGSDKIIFFSHRKDFGINDNQWHSLSQVRNIQGTAFMVPSNMVNWFTEEFTKTIDECLENKFIGSDEKILDITYLKNKEKYHLVECTWREYYNIFK